MQHNNEQSLYLANKDNQKEKKRKQEHNVARTPKTRGYNAEMIL